MSNFKPATVVFSLPGSSSSNKFDKPLDELIKQDGTRPADIKTKKQNKRLDLKGVVQKNVKENTKSKPARALNATKSENNPRLNKRADDKKGRARPVFIVPPQKDEPPKGGVKFNRPINNNHADEKVKIVVKNDQFKQKETKKKDTEPKERIRIRVNRTDDEMMDSDGDRDNTSPQRARHTDKKRRRSRDRSESDSDEEYKRKRRPYSVNQVQPSPMYMQPQYSVPAMAPAPVAAPMPRMYGTTAAPGAQGVFQNILHSILKQNIDERLNQTGLPPPPQPMPVRSYGYSYPVAQPVMEEPVQPLFSDNDRSGGLTLSQRFGSSSSSKSSSSSGTSKITVRLH